MTYRELPESFSLVKTVDWGNNNKIAIGLTTMSITIAILMLIAGAVFGPVQTISFTDLSSILFALI